MNSKKILFSAPYNTDGSCYESNFNVFWSLPPPENRPHEYPRPMLLSYTLSQEHFLSQDTLEEIVNPLFYIINNLCNAKSLYNIFLYYFSYFAFREDA